MGASRGTTPAYVLYGTLYTTIAANLNSPKQTFDGVSGPTDFTPEGWSNRFEASLLAELNPPLYEHKLLRHIQWESRAPKIDSSKGLIKEILQLGS